MTAVTPTRIRPVLRAGLVAAALLSLAACGGIADDAPTNASVEEFCTTYYDLESSAEDVAQKLAETGTPEGIGEQERDGFELYVDALNDEGGTANGDVTSVEVPQDDKADGEAFIAYADTTCADYVPGAAPGDAPSEPTEGAS
ncbi:hypothetical protein [Nocardioides litoris]|uniref:hypothetical protein n=1 Tax=Nocardioides litoris TaxID=1926648 RepID=UPI001122E226|nr:hypothetical protein [Nocardioides litoris]